MKAKKPKFRFSYALKDKSQEELINRNDLCLHKETINLIKVKFNLVFEEKENYFGAADRTAWQYFIENSLNREELNFFFGNFQKHYM